MAADHPRSLSWRVMRSSACARYLAASCSPRRTTAIGVSSQRTPGLGTRVRRAAHGPRRRFEQRRSVERPLVRIQKRRILQRLQPRGREQVGPGQRTLRRRAQQEARKGPGRVGLGTVGRHSHAHFFGLSQRLAALPGGQRRHGPGHAGADPPSHVGSVDVHRRQTAAERGHEPVCDRQLDGQRGLPGGQTLQAAFTFRGGESRRSLLGVQEFAVTSRGQDGAGVGGEWPPGQTVLRADRPR